MNEPLLPDHRASDVPEAFERSSPTRPRLASPWRPSRRRARCSLRWQRPSPAVMSSSSEPEPALAQHGCCLAWTRPPASTLSTPMKGHRHRAQAPRADARVTFHVLDGADFSAARRKAHYDLIYADAWPGKFSHLDDALSLLPAGDLLHRRSSAATELARGTCARRCQRSSRRIERQAGFVTVKLSWASGLMLAVRTGAGLIQIISERSRVASGNGQSSEPLAN